MDITDAIRQRRSVRSFDGQPLPASLCEELADYAAQARASNPFGGHFSCRIKEFDLRNGYRPTTYGMISGAVDFFLIGTGDDRESALAAGFCFEQVVLKAWQLGLGTCWIAATFKKTDFDTQEPWPDGEKLKIVCPVGVAAKKSFIERIARFTVASHRRKPFADLFFTGDFKHPLSPESRFGESLEMMRLAPSSTNSQPWRALTDGDTVHFYLVPKSRYSVLDCGIGLSHFYLTERFRGRTGRFSLPTGAPAAPGNLEYLVSYTAG